MKKIWKTLVLLGCLMAAMMLTACGGGKEVDFNDYINITSSGYDTMGRASYEFDEEKFLDDYGDKIKYTRNFEKSMAEVTDYDRANLLISGIKTSNLDKLEDSMAVIASFAGCDASAVMQEVDNLTYFFDKTSTRNTIEELSGYTPAKMLSLFANGSLTMSSHLSNGDEITFVWMLSEPDVEFLKNYFNYTLKFSDIDYTVQNLKDVRTFDAFEDVEVEYAGTSSQGKARVLNNAMTEPAKSIKYSISPDENLSNGMTVEVTIDNADKADSWVEKYGMVPETYKKEYIIEDLPEYVTELSQIPESVMNDMKEQAEDGLRAYIARNYVDYVSLDDLKFLGCYFLDRKNYDKNEFQNVCYLVYEQTISNSRAEETYTFYDYTYFGDIVIYPDGSCSVDLEGARVCQDYTRASGLTYRGLDSLDSVYNKCVTANLDKFNIESTVE